MGTNFHASQTQLDLAKFLITENPVESFKIGYHHTPKTSL